MEYARKGACAYDRPRRTDIVIRYRSLGEQHVIVEGGRPIRHFMDELLLATHREDSRKLTEAGTFGPLYD